MFVVAAMMFLVMVVVKFLRSTSSDGQSRFSKGPAPGPPSVVFSTGAWWHMMNTAWSTLILQLV